MFDHSGRGGAGAHAGTPEITIDCSDIEGVPLIFASISERYLFLHRRLKVPPRSNDDIPFSWRQKACVALLAALCLTQMRGCFSF